MQKKVDWIILATQDFEKSFDFYNKILEFDVLRVFPDEQFAQFKLDNIFLAIYSVNELEKLTGLKYSNSSNTAIYAFKESDDIQRDIKNLKDKGVVFIKDLKLQVWGQWTAYFSDPDGHVWEIQKWVDPETSSG